MSRTVGMGHARHRYKLAMATALLAGLLAYGSPVALASYPGPSREGLPPGVPIPAWAAGKSIHFYPATPSTLGVGEAAISSLLAPSTIAGPGAGAAVVGRRPAESPVAPPHSTSALAAPTVKSSASRLEYGGGPVQVQPRLVAIFWGTNWEREPGAELKPQLEKMLDGLAGSSWQKILTQYGEATSPSRVSEAPTIEVYDDRRVSAPVGVEFAKIEGEAEEVMAGEGAQASADATYMVLPAPETDYAQYFDTGFCGWHASMAAGRALAFVPYEGQPPFESHCGVSLAGADIPTSIAISHEYAESVTDPEPETGWAEQKNRQEIADLCNEPWRMKDGAWVTELWDDARGGCAGEDSSPEAVEFGPIMYPSEAEKASEISHTGATLEGSIAPCGREVHYYFEYGTTSALGTRSQVGVTPAGRWEYVPYRASIEGLQPGTTYYWRLVAEAGNGVVKGPEHVLHTTPYLELYVEWAEDHGTTETELYGGVNPNGEEATYYFEYGTTEAYGSRTTEASAGAGTKEVEISALIVGLSPTTTYHFRLVAKDGHGTFYSEDHEFVTGGAPPVETGEATEVGAFGATLSGAVGPDRGETQYYFEYGTTEAYGSSSPEGSEVFRDALAVSEALTGLAPGTLYHYRIVAINSFGASYGPDRVFTTEIAPSAQTEGATRVTANSATLSGSVDPNGVTATYRFEYHTGSEGSSSTPVQAAGSGTEDLKESADIAGLAPDTTYRYRLVASNELTTVDGEEETFTTANTPPPGPEVKTNPKGGPVPVEPALTSPAPTSPAGELPAPLDPAPSFSDLSLPKLQRGGVLSVGLTLGQPGSSVAIVVVLDRSIHGKHRRTPVVLARARRSGVAAGRLRLSVALDAEGMRELRRHRRLAVTVKILIRPSTGSPRTVSEGVTLER